MDIDLLKTFLEVEHTRHFGQAAYNLHLTQSAVSARIRLLEQQLGVRLFVRARHNIQLTRQGQRLLHHAKLLLQQWKNARADLAIDDDNPPQLLKINAIFMLWDMFLPDWLYRLYQQIEDIAVHAEADMNEMILRKLSDGLIDIGFILEPPNTLDLHIKPVAHIPLVLVSSKPNQNAHDATRNHYVQIDWGSQFKVLWQQHFSYQPQAVAQFGLARLGLEFLLTCEGNAYLPQHLCDMALAQQQLFIVEDAPIIELTVYVLYNTYNVRLNLVEQALTYFDLGH